MGLTVNARISTMLNVHSVSGILYLHYHSSDPGPYVYRRIEKLYWNTEFDPSKVRITRASNESLIPTASFWMPFERILEFVKDDFNNDLINKELLTLNWLKCELDISELAYFITFEADHDGKPVWVNKNRFNFLNIIHNKKENQQWTQTF